MVWIGCVYSQYGNIWRCSCWQIGCRKRYPTEAFYRQHCTPDLGSYTKDLSAICNDLSSVFILDNSPGAYRAYPGKLFCCIFILLLFMPLNHNIYANIRYVLHFESLYFTLSYPGVGKLRDTCLLKFLFLENSNSKIFRVNGSFPDISNFYVLRFLYVFVL